MSKIYLQFYAEKRQWYFTVKFFYNDIFFGVEMTQAVRLSKGKVVLFYVEYYRMHRCDKRVWQKKILYMDLIPVTNLTTSLVQFRFKQGKVTVHFIQSITKLAYQMMNFFTMKISPPWIPGGGGGGGGHSI